MVKIAQPGKTSFKWKSSPREKIPEVDAPTATELALDKEQPDGPWIVHGREAGSKNEYNVAMALDILRVYYIYQYSVMYGRLRRGGKVLDFFCPHIPPRPHVIDVRGRYWHGGGGDSKADLDLEHYVRLNNFFLIVVWEEDCATVQGALSYLRPKVKR